MDLNDTPAFDEDLNAAIATALARVLDINGWGIDQTTVPAGWVEIIAEAVRPEVDHLRAENDRLRDMLRHDTDPNESAVEAALDTIFQVRTGQPLPHPTDVARTASTVRRLIAEAVDGWAPVGGDRR